MDSWDFIRTAHHLAKAGTISSTADALGVHRATVLRHVDALEAELGLKLFHRHARGYVPTEAGQDLMRVAGATEDQFAQLVNRLKQQTAPLSGEFIITSLPHLVPTLMPLLSGFQDRHPGIQLRYLTGEKLFRLEFGEAHVAVRTGPKPDLPDNVAIPFAQQQVVLCAHNTYLARRGHPTSKEQLKGHSFIASTELLPKIPMHKWILNHISEQDMVLRSNDGQVIKHALLSAMGIGLMFRHEAENYPQLVEIFAPDEAWNVAHWLVTHRDLHQSAKVQAFLELARSSAAPD